MPQQLEAALAQLATLPSDEQDRVGRWLLEERRDEQPWDRQFSASQDDLNKLAAEALTDVSQPASRRAASASRSLPEKRKYSFFAT